LTQNLDKHINYPIYYHPLTWKENLILHFRLILRCPVCGHFSVMRTIRTDLQIREYCNCIICGAQNRQRQIAYVLSKRMGFSSLMGLSKNSQVSIYNTESGGILHNILSRTKNYTCSEYFGPQYKSGEIVNGVRHEDLQQLSFENDSFDILISADVFEHIPDPYKAHTEIFRVLKPGGRHIFTVPFYQEQILDERRAIINEKNEVIHLKEPLYHCDPLSSKGILVYNIFSLEMLIKMAEIGFITNIYLLKVPSAGIWGKNAVVFEAIKG
jgi:SAM-dependent methyltransferase